MVQELKVMSSGSAEPALDLVAEAYHQATGQKVHVTYDDKVLAEGKDSFDVILSSVDALDRNFRPKNAVEAGGVSVGRMGLGMAVRAGADVPQVTDMVGFRKLLDGLDRLILTTHTSGLYIERALARLDLFDGIAGRIERFANGPLSMDRLLAGQGREVVILSINQIRRYADRGVVFAGALPEEIQLSREFLMVPLSASGNKARAWEFVEFCGGPGRSILSDAGFTPA